MAVSSLKNQSHSCRLKRANWRDIQNPYFDMITCDVQRLVMCWKLARSLLCGYA